MQYGRQENLPFVGSSHEFVGVGRVKPAFRCSYLMGSPVLGRDRTGTPMTRSSSSGTAGGYGRSTARPSRALEGNCRGSFSRGRVVYIPLEG